MIWDCEKHAIVHVQFKHSRATKHYTSARFSAHETQNTIPVQVRAFAEYQTLRLCKFELSRATKHYIYAGLSAREPPNTTSVHVSALAKHQTLHLCRFRALRMLEKRQTLHLCRFWSSPANAANQPRDRRTLQNSSKLVQHNLNDLITSQHRWWCVSLDQCNTS